MIKHFFSVALCGLLLTSCAKKEMTTTGSTPHPANNPVPTLITLPGEDDDPPIIMERVKNREGLSLPNVILQLQCRDTTLIAHTDENGLCLLHLPYYGNWQLSLSHEDYQVLTTAFTVTDADTLIARTDTMIKR